MAQAHRHTSTHIRRGQRVPEENRPSGPLTEHQDNDPRPDAPRDDRVPERDRPSGPLTEHQPRRRRAVAAGTRLPELEPLASPGTASQSGPLDATALPPLDRKTLSYVGAGLAVLLLLLLLL